MPARWTISCAVFRFEQSNYYLNITPKTTVSQAKHSLLAAIKEARPPADEPVLSPEPATLPSSASDIALYIQKGSSWSRLSDDSLTADSWGITDAGEVGVSFKQSDGKFSDPTLVRPHEEPDEDDEDDMDQP